MSTKQNATCEELVERIKVLEETLAEYKDNAENVHSTVKKAENHQVIPAFTVVIDGAGRLVDMNSTMLNALGYTLDEVLGEDYLTKIVPAPEREMLQEVFDELMLSNNATINNNHVLTKSGELLLIEWHGTSVFMPDGETMFIIGIGIEVAEWRRCKEKCEKLITDICGA